jgi:hypothetical protein
MVYYLYRCSTTWYRYGREQMQALREDLPLVADMPEGIIRQVTWGDMIVETAGLRQDVDVAPFFRGLPDDRCQCPHWGYVLKGRLRYRFADHDEIYNAGELYYAAPGHTPFLEAGCEYIEFSPADELNKTMEVVERNMSS